MKFRWLKINWFGPWDDTSWYAPVLWKQWLEKRLADKRDAEHDAWWVIHSRELRQALRRANQGESPDMLYLELYANSEKG